MLPTKAGLANLAGSRKGSKESTTTMASTQAGEEKGFGGSFDELDELDDESDWEHTVTPVADEKWMGN